jgi:hypothetical protein
MLMSYTWNRAPIGRPKIISDAYLDRLKELVSHSPRFYGYPFERWTGSWLRDHLAKEFGLKVSDRHINRLLQQMGLSAQQRRQTTERMLVRHGQLLGIAIADLEADLDADLEPLRQSK